MSATCPNNPCKFLWWKWSGPHDWAHLHENSIRWGTGRYTTGIWVDADERTCRKCGRQERAEYKIIKFATEEKPELTGKWLCAADSQGASHE